MYWYWDSIFTEVYEGSADNKTVLVQVMGWHSKGTKPLSEPVMAKFIDA